MNLAFSSVVVVCLFLIGIRPSDTIRRPQQIDEPNSIVIKDQDATWTISRAMDDDEEDDDDSIRVDNVWDGGGRDDWDQEDMDRDQSTTSERRRSPFDTFTRRVRSVRIRRRQRRAAPALKLSYDRPSPTDSNPASSSSTNNNAAKQPARNGRPKKKLLIGYLAGTPFGNLIGDFESWGDKTNGSQLAAIGRIFRSRNLTSDEQSNWRRRIRREAEPEPDPASPLENLQVHIKEGNTTRSISMKILAEIFQRNDIIGTSKFLQGHLISGAMRYALETVNNDPQLLPDYELTYKFYNTRGLAKESVKSVMELWKMGAVAFIGPEDSCQSEALMAAAQNLPMISYKCADHSVTDKMKYTTFARTVPAEGEVAKATVAFLRQYKWNKFTVICQADEVHKQLLEGIEHWVTSQQRWGMTIQNTTWYSTAFNIDTKSSSEEVKRIVRETYVNTRVYVLLGDPGFVQLMLLEMGEQGLMSKGEYVVVYVDHTYGYIDADDAALNRYYRPTIQRTDIADKDSVVHKLVEWSRSFFVIIPTPVSFDAPAYKKFWSQVVLYNTQEPFKTYRPVTQAPSTFDKKNSSNNTTFIFDKKNSVNNINPMEPISNRYASYLYDAVMLYARALHEAILAKENYTNGTAIMQRIYGRKYMSMQGFEVKIDVNGDAKGNFTLLTRQNISKSPWNFTHSMVPSGWFVDNTQDPDELPELLLHNKVTIDWIGGKPPRDEPECGFHNELCIKEPNRTSEIAGSILAVLALVSGLIGLMIYRNWKIEKELAGLIWRVDPKEIQFITQDGYGAVLGASRVTLVSQDSNNGQETSSIWPMEFHCLAKFRGALVAIKEIQYARKMREITRATKMEMKKMRGLHHDNVNNFMGIIVKSNQIYVVREYCAKGSLYDVLLNENIKLDELFTASFIDDLLKAMCYLHESELKVHGNLKSTNCVVTSRWSLQVSDYGLHELREGQAFENEMQRYKSLLWTAPELLLAGVLERPQRGTQKADVFSFGIVLHEIFSRQGPYGIESDCTFSAKDIYMLIVKTREFHQSITSVPRTDEDLQVLGLVNMTKPYLPNLDDIQCQNYVKETLVQCWDERPHERPDFRAIRHRLKPLFKGILRRNIMDHMMAMMEKYQNHLEQLVDERTEALNEEKKRVETLLHRMLPDSVAAQLMGGEDVVPESYDAVTIYFSDIVGFTSLSAESTPMEVVNFLNGLYTLFDSIIRRYDVYKVETIGDAYMVVSGLPIRNDNHAGEIATMALHLLKAVETFQIPHRPDKKLLLRIGLHTGPCVAGVVGKTMPRYCLFGDTVNTASRMESNGLPLKIHCSEYVERALATLGGYILEERGLVPMKGKGEMLTYWLLAKQEFVMASPVDEFPSEPLFKTKDGNRPPTGNLNRRRIAAESLHQLPSRGESLTTVIRRTPSKRTDAVGPPTAAGPSKLLQPAPAFSSTVGKASSSTGGGGSSRNSRVLLPITADHSSICVPNGGSTTSSSDQQSHNRSKLAPLILPSGTDMLPPSYQECLRTKRQSLRAVCSGGKDLGACLRRRGSSGSGERECGMRKRSVSFPENVQALAEKFVNLGLGKETRNGLAMSRDANGNVTLGGSSSINSSTPKGTWTPCSRNCTPDRSRPPPSSNSAFPSARTAAATMCHCPYNGGDGEKVKNGDVANWDEAEMRNGNATHAGSKRQQVMKIIDSDVSSEDDGSPVVRKRSLSCGDASNLAMIGNGPSSLTEATTIATSDPQHIERALILTGTTNTNAASSQHQLPSAQFVKNGGGGRPGGVNFSISGGGGLGSRGNRGVGGSKSLVSSQNINPALVNNYRLQKAFLMENPDEDSPSDSPLLLKAEASASFSGPDSSSIADRHKRKRKSAVSLHSAFSRPFHSIWQQQQQQGQDSPSAASTPEAALGLTTGTPTTTSEKEKQILLGSGNRLNRFLRYLKRPLSNDPLEVNDHPRQPSLV